MTGATAAADNVTSPGVAYVDTENGTVSFVTADGADTDTGVSASFVGPVSDLTQDGTLEVPAIQSGDLLLVSLNGSATTLDGSGSVSGGLSTLTIGNIDNDDATEIVYPRNDRVYVVEPDGSPTAMTDSLGDGIGATAGYGDFDGDSSPELVIADGSQNIQYLDDIDANGNYDSLVDTSIGVGSNNGLAAGPLVDFDGDGTKRLAAIDGSQNLVLFDSDANKEIVYDNYQNAKKAPVGVTDVDTDGTMDLIHLDGSGNLVFAPYTGAASPQDITDSGGNLISADSKAGASGTAVGVLDAREPIVYDSAVVQDPGDRLQVTFNNSVTVDDPAQAATDITVEVDGTPVSVTNVADGSQNDTVELTLGQNVKFDESVSLSYNASTESIDGAAPGFRVDAFDDETVTNSVSEPANFTVAISDLNTPVVAGETLVATVSVQNTGEKTATQDITLANVTGATVDTTALQLAGAESASVNLTWNTTSDDAGTGDITVTSVNDSDTTTVKIDGNEPESVLVETHPENTMAGTDIGGPPAATVTDQIDEPLPNATVTVSTGGGVLSGVTEVQTNESGIAVFDSIQIVEAGSYALTFSVEGASDTATSDTFDVSPAVIETVELSPDTNRTAEAGATVEFDATAFDQFGNVVEDDDVAFNWTGADATGTFSAENVGSYGVTASLDSVTSQATTVTVEPNETSVVELSPAGDQTVEAGGTVEFAATALDQFGNVVEDADTAFMWSNANDTGAFSRETAGTYDVTASFDGVLSSATAVTVEPNATSTVELSPASNLTVSAGKILEFDATALDEFGNVVEGDNAAFNWTNTTGAGTFSEESTGTYLVTASYQNESSEPTTVVVEPGDIATVELSPEGDQTVKAGGLVEFDATALDQFGNVIEDNNAAFNWTNTTESGTFSEESAGAYVVTTSLDGVTSSPTTVTVEPGEFTSVTLSPDSDQTVQPAEVLEFEAMAVDQFDNVVEDDDTAFTWTNTSESGTFSEEMPGTYDVTATYQNVTSSATLVTVVETDTVLVDIQNASDVVEGQDIEVTAEFTNTGGVEAAQTVGFEITGLETTEMELTLGPGNSTVETVTVGTESGDVGTYAATVYTDDDADSTTVEVLELTDVFELQVEESNAPVTVGDDIEFLLNVTNSGYATDTQTVVLKAGVLGTVEVGIEELDAGESYEQTVTIETASQPAHVDEHELSLQSTGDSLATFKTHLPPVEPTLEPPNDPDGDDRYEDINGGGEFNIFDVQALFNNYEDETVVEHAWAYEFKQGGQINIFDVQALFNEL